jgi:hypothetical protein
MPSTTPRTKAEQAITALEATYSDRMEVNHDLTRALVSFQANKSEPIFRWFKYREGFSRDLVKYCLDHAKIGAGQTVLDPFAGTGATVFTASERGCNGIGIELLPVGSFFMSFRQLVSTYGPNVVVDALRLLRTHSWKKIKPTWQFSHIKITEGAFPLETEVEIQKFKTWLQGLPDTQARVLDFILFSVLEEISYTRKDGQYLRWDHRAGRTRGKSKFDKGKIFEFEEALELKALRIESDLANHEDSAPLLFNTDESKREAGEIEILTGTNFEVLEDIPRGSVDFALTSPPYCNRYDYTRTYALELAYLGIDEGSIRDLRQSLLTCTVENKPKSFNQVDAKVITKAEDIFSSSVAMTSIIEFLQNEIDQDLLNNKGILTMVRGYFLESAVHIVQMAKLIKRNGYYIMVNDNVQYNGLPIPVDCLLSEFAEKAGFRCEKIWILPTSKGNSSQQMKRHGRTEIRKCVYIWRKK